MEILGHKPYKRMAPQVGLEPTTLRLTGEKYPQPGTTPTNETQQNTRKAGNVFGTALAAFVPSSPTEHGQ